MIIADRFHLLAIQAARRIELLNMDPVESIRRALIYATSNNARPAYTRAALTQKESEVVFLLSDGEHHLAALAARLNISSCTAFARLKRLRERGLVRQARRGVWAIKETP